jgi:L,D-transpeptidase YcbB
MRLSRRKLLSSAAGFGAAMAFPALARAQENEELTFWEEIQHGRMVRETDRAGNTASAKSLVDTIEPILSFDTAYNLQLAIQNYEAFVAARGSWDLPTQEWFGLSLGRSRRAVREAR